MSSERREGGYLCTRTRRPGSANPCYTYMHNWLTNGTCTLPAMKPDCSNLGGTSSQRQAKRNALQRCCFPTNGTCNRSQTAPILGGTGSNGKKITTSKTNCLATLPPTLLTADKNVTRYSHTSPKCPFKGKVEWFCQQPIMLTATGFIDEGLVKG